MQWHSNHDAEFESVCKKTKSQLQHWKQLTTESLQDCRAKHVMVAIVGETHLVSERNCCMPDCVDIVDVLPESLMPWIKTFFKAHQADTCPCCSMLSGTPNSNEKKSFHLLFSFHHLEPDNGWGFIHVIDFVICWALRANCLVSHLRFEVALLFFTFWLKANES